MWSGAGSCDSCWNPRFGMVTQSLPPPKASERLEPGWKSRGLWVASLFMPLSCRSPVFTRPSGYK